MMFWPDRGDAFEAPRLAACLPGELCSYAALCNSHRATLHNGDAISCVLGGAGETVGGGVSPDRQAPEECVTCAAIVGSGEQGAQAPGTAVAGPASE